MKNTKIFTKKRAAILCAALLAAAMSFQAVAATAGTAVRGRTQNQTELSRGQARNQPAGIRQWQYDREAESLSELRARIQSLGSKEQREKLTKLADNYEAAQKALRVALQEAGIRADDDVLGEQDRQLLRPSQNQGSGSAQISGQSSGTSQGPVRIEGTRQFRDDDFFEDDRFDDDRFDDDRFDDDRFDDDRFDDDRFERDHDDHDDRDWD